MKDAPIIIGTVGAGKSNLKTLAQIILDKHGVELVEGNEYEKFEKAISQIGEPAKLYPIACESEPELFPKYYERCGGKKKWRR